MGGTAIHNAKLTWKLYMLSVQGRDLTSSTNPIQAIQNDQTEDEQDPNKKRKRHELIKLDQPITTQYNAELQRAT